MKKFLLAALAGVCIISTANAQQKTTAVKPATRITATTPAVSAKVFRQKTAELKASLNADNFTKAESEWMDVHHTMARRADELRKLNGDTQGAEKRMVLVGRLKDLSQNIAVNKAALLQLLNEMDAAY